MVNFLLTGIFQDLILPFILIFVIIFAILQKTKLFGDGVQQINAVVAFVIAGIFVAFSAYVVWLKSFVIFLAIALFILFVFMLIYGFTYADEKGFTLRKEFQIIIAVMAFIAVIIAGLVITNTWDMVYNFFTTSNTGSNILFVVLIALAVGAVLFSGSKKEKKD